MNRILNALLAVATVVIAMVLIVAAQGPVGNSVASFSQLALAADEIEVQGTITAKGRFVFSWVDDDLCQIQFWDYDFTPNLVVTDASDRQLASLQLSELPGVVTMEGSGADRHAESCDVPYTLTVPASDTYRVVIDPYFTSEPMSVADLENGVDINFERQKDDTAPDFRKRPSGPIAGMDLNRIAGSFELLTDDDPDDLSFMEMPLGGCVTFGGYDDIKMGAQITVKDEKGAIIGVGELEPIYTGMERCQFAFTIDVPDATFYTLEMGRRGTQTYSKQDLEEADWHVDLSIGP